MGGSIGGGTVSLSLNLLPTVAHGRDDKITHRQRGDDVRKT